MLRATTLKKYDLIIVGAGIVGAACARKFKQEHPQLKVMLLEKEAKPALHQTGRNSGVIHAGVYYAPGSLKAKYCREGLERTISYCQQYDLPYLQCGKMIVATSDIEEERLQSLFERCQHNNLAPELCSESQLQVREPNVTGQVAIFVKQTGITNYTAITEHFLQSFCEAGGNVQYSEQVTELSESDQLVTVTTERGSYQSSFLLNCGGLHSDVLIRKLIPNIDWRIVPFKGEYFLLPQKYNDVVQHLIYPVPDPELPFLGVHLTRMIDGTVTVGPNAVLALGKEAYDRGAIQMSEVVSSLGYSGLRKVMLKNWRSGIQEFKNSMFKSGYLNLVQKYCPQIKLEDLLSYPAGIRAQAVSDKGELIHDFRFAQSARSLHIGNAPSPAATSAMPIADAIYKKIKDNL